jgi:hypothetical protein
MGPSARRVLVSVGVAAAVVAGVAVVTLRAGHAHKPAAPSAVHPAIGTADRSNVLAVTKVLTGLPAAFAAGRTDVLTPTAAVRFRDVRAALPADSTVTVLPQTWRRTGRIGSLEVTVRRRPGQATTTFMVVLVHEPNGWKVSSTYPASPR